MNKRWFIPVAALCLLLGPALQASYAGCNNNACSNVKIGFLNVFDDGVSLAVTGGTVGTQCQGFLGTIISLPNDHPRRKEIYALVLATKLADKTISFTLATGTCSIKNALLSS